MKDKLLHLAIPVNREEAEHFVGLWLLKAAYTTFGNTAVTHLLGDLDSCQFEWVPGQESAL